MTQLARCIAIAFFLVTIGNPAIIYAQIAPINTATVSGTVSDSAGKPVVGANVSVTGPKKESTRTNSAGQFVFVDLPLGTYDVTASTPQQGTASRAGVSVQGDINIAIQYSSNSGLKTIANVSSSANAGFNITSASITQVNPQSNAFEGKTSWRTILEQIPGVAQAGLGNGRNFYASLPDGPFVPVQLSINGTLPYETAILLDGMPLIAGSLSPNIGGTSFGSRAAGTGTDLSVYALNSFSAADIVRGPGAGAPSIVDSIGGSFVLHAPGEVTRNHYEFSVSNDAYGGFIDNGAASIRSGKLSLVGVFGLNQSPGPLSVAGIPETTIVLPNTVDGMPFACTGACAQTSLLKPGYTNASYGLKRGFLICCPRQTTGWGQQGGSISLNYAFSPLVHAGIFYTGQIAKQLNSTSEYQELLFSPPSSYAGPIAPGNYLFNYNGEALGAENVDQQISSLVEEKLTAQIGHGALTLAAVQNRTFLRTILNAPTSANFQLFGGGVECATSSPACGTPANPGTAVVFNGEAHNLTFPVQQQLITGSTNNRDELLSYQSPIGENFHGGASFVKSYYNIPQNLSVVIGTININQITPSDISESTNEGRFFIGGLLFPNATMDLSYYFVKANYHVPDPNKTTSPITPTTLITYLDRSYTYSAPRLGFVWHPKPALAVRLAAGGGFAEAPLTDLVGTNSVPRPNNPSAPTFYTMSVTNVNLQPERSFAFDAGVDLRLAPYTIASLDVYRSNLYGQIYSSSGLTGTFNGLPLYTTQFGNLGASRYEGILLDVRNEPPHGFNWSFSGGLTRGYVVSVPSGFYDVAGSTCNRTTAVGCQNLTVMPGINFNGTFAPAIPYAQALATLGYRWLAGSQLNLAATYYGNNNTYFRPAFVELDASAGIPLNKNVSLLARYRNITGIYGGAAAIWNFGDIIGAPTIAGPLSPLYGEMYGPRALLLTTQIRM